MSDDRNIASAHAGPPGVIPVGVGASAEAFRVSAERPGDAGQRGSATPHTGPMIPCLRLFTDRVMVDGSDGLGRDFEEVEAALMALSFDYAGTIIDASEGADLFLFETADRAVESFRDTAAEARARYVLESFGAVDLECLDQYGVSPDVRADYIVCCDGDVHSYCAFSAYIVPQLREMGWNVVVDEGHRYKVVEREVPWYAVVEPQDRRPDWFSLELGIEIDGTRMNLLPALLDLLDKSTGGQSFRSIARGHSRCLALPIGEHRYLPVPPERIRELMHVMMELYNGDEGGGTALRFSNVQASALDRLGSAFRDGGATLTWEGDEQARRLGQALATPGGPASIPADLQATLRPYQQEGLDWLQHLRAHGVGGILADDMGLGKTLQTIAHLAVEKAAGRAKAPSLVVALTSLMGNWEREIARFAPFLRTVVLHGSGRHELFEEVPDADVVITSYPLLVRDLDRFSEQSFHMLVLDEAHTVKNTRSRAHQAVQSIDAEHRLCLTGTPVENHLGELWSLMDFLNPGLLGDELGFRRWYRMPIERQGDEDRLAALKKQLSPYILRRVKDQVATELPPKTELLRPIELCGRQRDLYESIRVAAHDKVRKVIRKKGLAASTVSILDALTKLRQVCCDPRLVRMDAARLVRQSAKHDVALELISRQLAEGHRILLFSQFTSMLSLLSKGLKERGIGHLSLTGSTQNRQRVIDAFEGGQAEVFLISLKAGGTGLTLTSADTVIHYDPWWNPAVQAQATDRAYRIGQTKPVFVYNLFVAGSVEERMLRLQDRKRKLANAILGAPTRTELLTEADVDLLFAPLG